MTNGTSATKSKKTKKRAGKSHPQTTYEAVESALASTASFAATVARGLASSLSSHPTNDPAPHATDLLVSQHRKVEKLFDRLESPKGEMDTVLRELADQLTAHIAIEEKLFYPAVRKLDSELILEGLEEHAMGRYALKRLLGTKASDASLEARLKALQELMVNHHKEEENELFPKVRKAMSDEAAKKLGRSMKALFEAEVERGHQAVLATFDDEPGKPTRATAAKPRAKHVGRAKSPRGEAARGNARKRAA